MEILCDFGRGRYIDISHFPLQSDKAMHHQSLAIWMTHVTQMADVA